ncbi:hypothetical protein GCM10028817_01580 [Spirosoma pomorum]
MLIQIGQWPFGVHVTDFDVAQFAGPCYHCLDQDMGGLGNAVNKNPIAGLYAGNSPFGSSNGEVYHKEELIKNV